VADFILSILATARVFLRSRGDTALEILALRQQVAVLKRKRPRPTLNSLDRLFWTTLRRVCPCRGFYEGTMSRILKGTRVMDFVRGGGSGDPGFTGLNGRRSERPAEPG